MQLELERVWHICTTISRKIYSLVIHSHLKTQEHLSSLDMTTDLEESDCFGKISKHFILFDNLPRSPILLFDAQHKMQFILVLCFVCTTAEISRMLFNMVLCDKIVFIHYASMFFQTCCTRKEYWKLDKRKHFHNPLQKLKKPLLIN